jgi:hypothetical protein
VTEHTYSRKLKERLVKTGRFYQWKINDPFSNGVPDRFIEGPNKDLWLEAKRMPTLPKRDSTIIDLLNPDRFLSKLQAEWLLRRHTKRGDAAVLLSIDGIGATLFFDAEWLIPISTGDLKRRLMGIDEIVTAISNRT